MHSRSLLRIVLTLIGLSTGHGFQTVCLADEPRNLLKNPGAEGADGDQVESWGAIAVPPNADVRLKRATNQSHSGKASLLGEVKGGDGFVQWVQNVDEFPRGSKMHLTGYIKSKGNVKAHIMFQAFDEAQQLVAVTGTDPIEGSRDWTKVRSQTADIPREAKVIIVRLVLSGKGQAWFDDLSLAVEGTGATDARRAR
jgi:hypothetical protein